MASHIPQNNGRWSDPARPGDSVWFPDMDSVPAGSNDPYRPKTFRRNFRRKFRQQAEV